MRHASIIKLALLAPALALTLLPALAAAAEWTIDPAHTSVQFTVRHMMMSNVNGHFSGVSGGAAFDPAKPADGKFTAEIETKTINTGIEKRDEHLRSADFFDVEKFPKATFVSKKITVAGPGKFKMVGDLDLHGVKKEVTFDVEGFDRAVKDPFGQTRIGGTATATINRKDFGLTWNKAIESGGVLVGEDIKLNLGVELTEKTPQAAGK